MRSATSSSGRAAISLARCEFADNFVHRRSRGGKRKRREIGDGPAGEFYREGLRPEAFAVADTAEGGRHVLRHPLAVGIGPGLFEVALKEFENALEPEPFVCF